MFPADKERRVGHFVADEMGIEHDDQDNYTFVSPGQYEDFRSVWQKVMDALIV